MAFCANCGTQMGDTAAFCPGCGGRRLMRRQREQVGALSGRWVSGNSAPPNPASARSATTATSSAAALSPLAENIAGMLAYFTIIPAIIFLLIEPYNRNRFRALPLLSVPVVAVALSGVTSLCYRLHHSSSRAGDRLSS